MSKEIVAAFATALDNEDYIAVRALLAADCRYDSPTGLLIGPDAIIASYRGNGDAAKARFDSIGYDHSIATHEPGRYRITFIDEITIGRLSHVFRCEQDVAVDDQVIAEIAHHEIPGQRDRLDNFLAGAEATSE